MKLELKIPKRMREMQRDHRGYPVPYVIMRDKTGRPHFTINDQGRQLKCLAQKRCQICGKKLERTFWFVGGPQAAFHEHGGYTDSMMHEECLEYALRICPYLAMRKYSGRIDTGTLDAETLERVVLLDHTMVPERPEVFVAVKAAGFDIHPGITVTPHRPYLEVQYWRHGQRLSEEEGMRLGFLVRNRAGEIVTDPLAKRVFEEKLMKRMQ
jgi:hypothetical protein